MKDRPLKDVLLRHFAAQRALVQPEVVVYCPSGVSRPRKALTDVDVFALRPVGHRFERVLGDCKALAGQSPFNRVLWVRGLMDLLKGDAGCVLLDVPSIESDHKLAASKVGVRLLGVAEFREFDRAIVYPTGSEDVPLSLADLMETRDVVKKFPALANVVSYVYGGVWQETDFGPQIRHAIGHVRSASRQLDPVRNEHLALIGDAAACFAVAVAQCAATIFDQYLKPSQKGILSDALKIVVWGGKDSYDFYQNVQQKMLRQEMSRKSSQNPSGEASSLELPEWDRFVDLVRELLEKPSAAFLAPSLLQRLAVDLLKSRPFVLAPDDEPMTVKFAVQIASYLCRASKLPPEFAEKISQELVRAEGDRLEKR